MHTFSPEHPQEQPRCSSFCISYPHFAMSVVVEGTEILEFCLGRLISRGRAPPSLSNWWMRLSIRSKFISVLNDRCQLKLGI